MTAHLRIVPDGRDPAVVITALGPGILDTMTDGEPPTEHDVEQARDALAAIAGTLTGSPAPLAYVQGAISALSWTLGDGDRPNPDAA